MLAHHVARRHARHPPTSTVASGCACPLTPHPKPRDLHGTKPRVHVWTGPTWPSPPGASLAVQRSSIDEISSDHRRHHPCHCRRRHHGRPSARARCTPSPPSRAPAFHCSTLLLGQRRLSASASAVREAQHDTSHGRTHSLTDDLDATLRVRVRVVSNQTAARPSAGSHSRAVAPRARP